LVVVKLTERLSVGKSAAQKFNMRRFDLRKLNDEEVKEEYQVKISTGLQLCRTWLILWISIGLGKILERI
jgi:hypothetical protein